MRLAKSEETRREVSLGSAHPAMVRARFASRAEPGQPSDRLRVGSRSRWPPRPAADSGVRSACRRAKRGLKGASRGVSSVSLKTERAVGRSRPPGAHPTAAPPATPVMSCSQSSMTGSDHAMRLGGSYRCRRDIVAGWRLCHLRLLLSSARAQAGSIRRPTLLAQLPARAARPCLSSAPPLGSAFLYPGRRRHRSFRRRGRARRTPLPDESLLPSAGRVTASADP
jgi:hypothetical protein